MNRRSKQLIAAAVLTGAAAAYWVAGWPGATVAPVPEKSQVAAAQPPASVHGSSAAPATALTEQASQAAAASTSPSAGQAAPAAAELLHASRLLRLLREAHGDGDDRTDADAQWDSLEPVAELMQEKLAAIASIGVNKQGEHRALFATFETDPDTGEWRPVTEVEIPIQGYSREAIELPDGSSVLAYAVMPGKLGGFEPLAPDHTEAGRSEQNRFQQGAEPADQEDDSRPN